MITKEHFNSQGMTKLATLKNLINFGLSDSLKEAFPDLDISLIDTMSYNYHACLRTAALAALLSAAVATRSEGVFLMECG